MLRPSTLIQGLCGSCFRTEGAWEEGLRGVFPPLPPLFYFATCFGCLLIHPSAPVNDLPARHSPLRHVTNKKATGKATLKTSKRGLATDESPDYIIVALFQTDPHGRIATTKIVRLQQLSYNNIRTHCYGCVGKPLSGRRRRQTEKKIPLK